MNNIKSEIELYEKLIEKNKLLADEQLALLKSFTTKQITSPYVLGGVLVLTFLATRQILKRKKNPREKSEKKSTSERFAKIISNASLMVSAIRLVQKLL